MVGLTIVAWIIDVGFLLQLVSSIQYKMRVLPDRGWQGAMMMIVLAAVLTTAIVGSAALLLASEARWARISALVVAGALPGAGAAVLSVMLLGAVVVAISGGRFN